MFGSSVGEPGVLRPPSPGSGRRQGRGRRRWGPGSGQTSPQPSWCRGKERVDAGWAGDSEVRPRDFCVDFRPLPGGRLVRPPRGQAQAPIHDAGGGQTAAPPPDARVDVAVGQAAWDLGRAFSVGSGYCPSKDARGARCLHRGLGALSEQPCPAETALGFCPRLRVQRRRACCTGWPGSWSAGSVPSAETRDDPSGGQGRGPRRSRFGGEGHAEGAVQRMGGEGLGPGERAEVGAREPRAL